MFWGERGLCGSHTADVVREAPRKEGGARRPAHGLHRRVVHKVRARSLNLREVGHERQAILFIVIVKIVREAVRGFQEVSGKFLGLFRRSLCAARPHLFERGKTHIHTILGCFAPSAPSAAITRVRKHRIACATIQKAPLARLVLRYHLALLLSRYQETI